MKKLKNKEIESKLQKSINSSLPNIWEKVAFAPVEKMDKHDYITEQTEKASTRPYFMKQALIAALSFVLCIGIYGLWNNFLSVDTIFGLDVNPSIELSLSKQERVISCQALNEDAKIVLAGLDLRFTPLNTALQAIVGSMYQKGYLTGDKNAILITVQNDDQRRAGKLQKDLASQIDNILSQQKNNPTHIMMQHMPIDQKSRQEAQKQQLSPGIVHLINKILQQNSNYSFDQLAKLSLDDLYHILEKEDKSIQDIDDDSKDMDSDSQDIDGDSQDTDDANDMDDEIIYRNIIGKDEVEDSDDQSDNKDNEINDDTDEIDDDIDDDTDDNVNDDINNSLDN